MAAGRVVVVEDDSDISEVLRHWLAGEGFGVLCAATGEEGLQTVRKEAPQLLILDLMLPGIDGLEVLRKLKQDPETRAVPVIIVSAKSEEADIVLGLGLGADDYVTKPFSPRELLARVRTVLRRRHAREAGPEDGQITWNGLVIDAMRHEVKVDGQLVPFTTTELRLLYFLASRPGRVFTRDLLVQRVLGKEAGERTIDVHVQSIRKKLGPYGNLVVTVRGVGYRLLELN